MEGLPRTFPVYPTCMSSRFILIFFVRFFHDFCLWFFGFQEENEEEKLRNEEEKMKKEEEKKKDRLGLPRLSTWRKDKWCCHFARPSFLFLFYFFYKVTYTDNRFYLLGCRGSCGFLGKRNGQQDCHTTHNKKCLFFFFIFSLFFYF